MAISAKSVGTWAVSNATTQTVTLPTHAAGDMLIVRAAAKPYNGTITCGTTGWQAVGPQYANGATANGNGLGSLMFRSFWKVATSAAETSPVITWGTTSAPGGAVAVVYQKAATEEWVAPTGAGGGDATARTAHTATISVHISVTAGDMVDFWSAWCDNYAATVPSITQAGVTFGAVTEYPATALSSATSNDMAADGGYRLASSGTSSAAAVVTGTFGNSEQGGSWQTRLRVFTPTRLLWFGSPAAGASRGQGYVDFDAATQRAGHYDMPDSRYTTPLTRTLTTVAGPTNGLATVGSNSEHIEWITPPLQAGITISGTITVNLWALVSNAAAAAAVNVRISRLDSTNTFVSDILKTTNASALTTTAAAYQFTGTPTSTTLAKGDRIRFVVFFDDAPTMVTGHTCTFKWGTNTGPLGDGDSWVHFSENVLVETSLSLNYLYFTNTASDINPESIVAREIWNSRGAGVQTAVTNTVTGWTAPVRVTQTAGGTQMVWYTRKLAAFTLSGIHLVSLRYRVSSLLAFAAVGCELAVVDEDGTNPVVWARSVSSAAAVTTEGSASMVLSGADYSVAAAKRLRFTVFLDDGPNAAGSQNGTLSRQMVSGYTGTFFYAGADGATGDAYVWFNNLLTEFSLGGDEFPYVHGGYYP